MNTLFETYNGSGGPDNNAIPAYATHKAPKGPWVYDKSGNQLMVENGTLVFALGAEVNDRNYSEYEIASGDYSGVVGWLENSHVRLYNVPEIPEKKGCSLLLWRALRTLGIVKVYDSFDDAIRDI